MLADERWSNLCGRVGEAMAWAQASMKRVTHTNAMKVISGATRHELMTIKRKTMQSKMTQVLGDVPLDLGGGRE